MKKSFWNRVYHLCSLKFTLKMKLTLLFGVLSFFQLQAFSSYAQNTKVSLNFNKVAIDHVFKEIESQTEFKFFYNIVDLDVQRIVTIKVRRKNIFNVLKQLFKDSDISYKVVDRQIVLTRVKSKEQSAVPIIDLDEVLQSVVSGTITDKDGTPLPGASIVEKGTINGTQTDFEGNFTLEVSNPDAVLLITYIGFETQEIPVDGKSTINVSLNPSVSSLDEVVIVGYGTQKKVNLTGSVESVEAEEILKRPANNVANLLQGRVSGLQILQRSGEPGNNEPVIRIRGLGTIPNGTRNPNTPLILIDGVQGSLNSLNPQNVESISVLKDAASAAIYGSRGASGVILVTTKRGSAGGLKVQYTTNYQLQRPINFPEFVTNSADFMSLYNQANERANIRNFYTEEEIETYRNATDRARYPNFDWVDHMFTDGSEQNHFLSINGGNEKTRFNVSLGTTNQKGIFIQDAYKFSRHSLLFNLDSKFNDFVSFGSNLQINYAVRNRPVTTGNIMAQLVYTAGPNYRPRLSDGSGLWTWRYNGLAFHNRNPEQTLSYGSVNVKDYNVQSQVFLDFNLAKGLVFNIKGAVNADLSFTKSHENEIPSYFYSDNSFAASSTSFLPGVSDQFDKNILTTLYSTLNYNKSFGEHNLSAQIGYSQEENHNRLLRAYKRDFPAENIDELDGGSDAFQQINGNSGEWAIQSLFGRVNYNYKEKYLLEGVFRYDGTSRISKDYRWGFFPSFSAGWDISKEKFMEPASWLNQLKIRGSWGQIGNQNIGLFPYQNILDVNLYPFGSQVETGAAVSRLTDQTLQWETSTQTGVGLDLNIKNGMFTLTADWYKKITSDILYGIEIPASIGLAPPTINFAEMENKGFDFVVGHANQLGNFRYSVDANFSTFRNKVLKVKAPILGTLSIQEGLPWQTYFVVEHIGIFQNQEEIDNGPLHPFNPKPGDLKFRDQNGDNVIDADDRIAVDGVLPKYFYGGTANLGWKNFDLTAFFQGVEGQKTFMRSDRTFDPFNQSSAPRKNFVANMWTPENPSNTHPAIYRSGYGPVNGTASTYLLGDASYFRLKNLMIGFNFPSDLCQRNGMKNLRLFVSGDNLFTITDYPLGDPEAIGLNAAYPQIQTYTIGLNVEF